MNKLWGTVLTVGVLAIIAFMLYPVFAPPVGNTHPRSCLSQMKQLSTCMAIYTTDFDDRISQEKWMDATYPYSKNWGIYTCVDLYSRNPRDSSEKKPVVSGYALNYRVLGANIDKANPKCAMFFEIDALGPDVVAGANARSMRHQGSNVAYTDGTAHFLGPGIVVREVP